MHALILTRSLRHGDAVTSYCVDLADVLLHDGLDVTALAHDGDPEPGPDGLRAEYVDVTFDAINVFDWSMMLNNELQRRGIRIAAERGVDVVHANDWATVPAGVLLSKALGIPFFLTLHSTENQRGFNGKHPSLLSKLEWRGCYEADRVFVNDGETRDSVAFDLEVPAHKIVQSGEDETWHETVQNTYRYVLGGT